MIRKISKTTHQNVNRGYLPRWQDYRELCVQAHELFHIIQLSTNNIKFYAAKSFTISFKN